jgi:ATP-dependent DNA ligase
VLDGELFSGERRDGIDAIITARNSDGADVAFGAFDVLQLDGQDVMREPWGDRRKRLDDVFVAGVKRAAHAARPRVRRRPGEGIVLTNTRIGPRTSRW